MRVLFSELFVQFSRHQSSDELLIVYRTIAFIPAVYGYSKHSYSFWYTTKADFVVALFEHF
jgi:hypothetical protein